MNFSNISPVQNKILCILVFCNSVLFFVCIYFFTFSVCIFYAFRHEVQFNKQIMVVHKVIKSKKKTENDMKIETKEKICTQTSQNGVTKKCSIYIAKKNKQTQQTST